MISNRDVISKNRPLAPDNLEGGGNFLQSESYDVSETKNPTSQTFVIYIAKTHANILLESFQWHRVFVWTSRDDL